MKHFGALLTGTANEVDGGENSVLTVGANDSLVILTPNTMGGQTLDGSLDGLVINSPRGETHVIGADGREINSASFGHAGGTFNPTTNFLPVKGLGSTGFEWEDSYVSMVLARAGGTTATGVLENSFAAGDNFTRITFTVANQAAVNAILAVYPLNSRISATATFAGGQVVQGTVHPYETTATTVRIIFTDGQGTFGFAANAGTNVTFPLTAGAITPGNVRIEQQDGTAVGLEVSGDAIVEGSLTVNGALTFLSSTNSSVEDQYIALNQPADNAVVAPTQSGVLVQVGARGGDITAGAGTFAGIRFNDVTDAWELNLGDSTAAGVGTWSAIGIADAGVTSVDAIGGINLTGLRVSDNASGNQDDGALDGITTIQVAANTREFNLTHVTNGSAGTGGHNLGLADNGIREPKIATAVDTTGTPDRGQAAPSDTHYILAANRTAAMQDLFTYIEPATGNPGTVTKFSDNFTKAAGTTFIQIAQTTHGLDPIDLTDANENLYTVQVYETTTNSVSQILPQGIFVASGNAAAGDFFSGSPTAVAGDVVLQFGATAATLNGFVVIKS